MDGLTDGHILKKVVPRDVLKRKLTVLLSVGFSFLIFFLQTMDEMNFEAKILRSQILC